MHVKNTERKKKNKITGKDRIIRKVRNKSRACKIFLLDEQHNTYLHQTFLDHFDFVNELVFQAMRAGKHEKFKQPRYFRDFIVKEHKAELLAAGVVASAWYNSLTMYIVERYYAIKKRHKKAKFKKRTFTNTEVARLASGILQLKDDSFVSIKPIDGSKRIASPIKFAGTMGKHRQFVSDASGGNLVDNMFVARANIPIIWQYNPTNVIGIDINKRPDVFIVVADTDHNHIQTMASDDALQDMVYDLNQLNGEIDNAKRDGLTSKQRRRRRKRVIKIHKRKYKHIYENYVMPLVKLAKKNRALLCIDDAKTGAKNGSYGQDDVINGLKKACENESVPFVVVPPHYTSRMCVCGKFGDRINDETLLCLECGSKFDADIHGAYNVARFGRYMWIHGEARLKRWIFSRNTSKVTGSLLPA